MIKIDSKVHVVENDSYFTRSEEGQLEKFTKDGEPIKWWKVSIRKRDSKKIKDKCEECNSKENLTIDHQPPLGMAPWKSKPVTLCLDCCRKKGDYNTSVNGYDPRTNTIIRKKEMIRSIIHVAKSTNFNIWYKEKYPYYTGNPTIKDFGDYLNESDLK